MASSPREKEVRDDDVADHHGRGCRAFPRRLLNQGAEKRAEHGAKSSTVWRDPNQADRVWALFDWSDEGWKAFVEDPEVPPILQEAGHKDIPQVAALAGEYYS